TIGLECDRGATGGRFGVGGGCWTAMSTDDSRPSVRRPRQVEFLDLPDGPARELRDAIYRLYLEAGSPTLDDLVARIAGDDTLPGAPERDVISRIISGGEVPAVQQDAVTVAATVVLNTAAAGTTSAFTNAGGLP